MDMIFGYLHGIDLNITVRCDLSSISVTRCWISPLLEPGDVMLRLSCKSYAGSEAQLQISWDAPVSKDGGRLESWAMLLLRRFVTMFSAAPESRLRVGLAQRVQTRNRRKGNRSWARC